VSGPGSALRNLFGRGRTREPRLGLVMLVRDEAELIERNLIHHHRQGFDRIMVMDNGSTDGTRDKLAELAKLLPLTVIDQPDQNFLEAEWATDLSLRLLDFGIDWGIRVDADEFLTVDSGNLKSRMARINRPMLCERENVLPLAADSLRPDYDSLKDSRFRVARPLGSRRGSASPFPVVLRTLPGKVMFPLKGLSRVAPGNHSVTHDLPTRRAPAGFLVRHFPVRPFSRFMQQLDRWERVFEAPASGQGAHLRRLVDLRRRGLIEEEYASFSIAAGDADRLLADGTIVRDSFGASLACEIESTGMRL
jgi:hypothetical protein